MIDKIRDTMNEYVGIIRTEHGLRNALNLIEDISSKARTVSVEGDLKFNQGLIACIELQNMATLAECIIRSAIARKESRGAHARSDYPNQSKEWRKNIMCSRYNGRLKLHTIEARELPKRLQELVPRALYNG
jgi:succinate dehydrogenase / fumarate reductase flavoprotein subunit